MSQWWPKSTAHANRGVYACVRFTAVERVGIRELRANAAAVVRRAEAGQRTTITVGGRPVAEVAPLTSAASERTLDELIAQGLLIAPRRTGRPNDATIPVWGTLRLDRLLREVRG
jgi:prevent-host-death family protein